MDALDDLPEAGTLQFCLGLTGSMFLVLWEKAQACVKLCSLRGVTFKFGDFPKVLLLKHVRGWVLGNLWPRKEPLVSHVGPTTIDSSAGAIHRQSTPFLF